MKILNPFFPHDTNAREDIKIKKMLFHFRKESELKAQAAVCIFWWIIEDMHRDDDFKSDELEVYADNYRCDVKFLKSILEDFNLFKKEENGCYISDRVLKNKGLIDKKSQKAKESAECGWLLSAFKKYYMEFFKEEPVLDNDEIEKLKNYRKKIPDLKEKLRDILFTLKNLKFDNDINFRPCANWLLKDKNLARLINGEFGGLKHCKTAKELKEEQKQQADEEQKRNQPGELEIRTQSCSSKEEVLKIIAEYYENKRFIIKDRKFYGLPELRKIMKKFDITDKEVIKKCQE